MPRSGTRPWLQPGHPHPQHHATSHEWTAPVQSVRKKMRHPIGASRNSPVVRPTTSWSVAGHSSTQSGRHAPARPRTPGLDIGHPAKTHVFQQFRHQRHQSTPPRVHPLIPLPGADQQPQMQCHTDRFSDRWAGRADRWASPSRPTYTLNIPD